MSAPQSPATDRRQHERRTLRSAAQLALPGRPVQAVRMLHISAGGMGIVGPANLPAKTTGLLRLSIPRKSVGSDTFDVNVVVTHSVYAGSEDGFKIGLEFSNMPAAMSSAVSAYLAM
jgi:c-di-GMP-binding flagellar brake protein YcgR